MCVSVSANVCECEHVRARVRALRAYCVCVLMCVRECMRVLMCVFVCVSFVCVCTSTCAVTDKPA